MNKKFLGSVLCVCLLTAVVFTGCGAKNDRPESLNICDNKIECGMDMQDILKSFEGHKFEYSESISCAYSGMDKIYDYTDDGFMISTYPEGEKDYVLEVAVYSDKISQLDGKVKVGESKENIVELFGEHFENDGDIINYKVNDKQSMYFLITDGKVVEYGISIAE